jgi:cytochrome c-type biogenesis protein CcmE
MKNKNIVIAVIITAIIAGGLGFWGGKATAGSCSVSATAGQSARSGNFAGRGAGAGGMATAGSVVSNDGSSLTISLRDGSSKIVFFSASTTVLKATTGSSADLTSGTNVVVSGKTNTDGSVTASSIQIRPTSGF